MEMAFFVIINELLSISVFEVGISTSKLDNKKSTGSDGISVKPLKIAHLT